MKLEKIKFNNHEIFNDLEVDFKDNNGKILYIIVIIGENSSGKTTLLKSIYDLFDRDQRGYEEVGDNKVELTPALYTATVKLEDNEIGMLSPEVLQFKYNPTDPKVVYMPTEMNFEKINKVDITGLSSGEKQLFLRALSLKFLEVNNSIILIDEPEISLHPQWQRKIIDVYKSIGNNNQLIIATHSPHVIGNITSDELRVMIKDDNGIKLIDNDNLSENYDLYL